MVIIVKEVSVTAAKLEEVWLQSGRKGEPVAQRMALHEYKFEDEDPYPAWFWKQRQGKAVAVFGEYRDEYVGDDEDGNEKTERWLFIQSVLDLPQC
jgi:hypothetical protein